MKIWLYDTTLRDGTQAEDVNFSAKDKVRVAHKLDELGIHYIEGGWPGSNPKDLEFFKLIKKNPPAKARICAFGSTARAGVAPARDANIQALIKAETPVVTVVGKSWDMQVAEALRIGNEENLDIIRQSIRYLKAHADEVFFDAEHFFDGYAANPAYALATLDAALEGGADALVLCDTNGGSLPSFISKTVKAARKGRRAIFGIHCHNDSDLAVANTIAGVEAGATQVQGTVNGYGERSGNANLISVIPNVMLKMGHESITLEQLKGLREVSRFVDELANLQHFKHQPFVGDSAFAHKGGIHVSAVQRNRATYEHIDPALVGNSQRILVSDLSGRANILAKARQFGISFDENDPRVGEVLEDLKRLESEGFLYEGAEASFEILIKKRLGRHRKFFDLLGFRVIDEKRDENEQPIAEATIMLRVGDEIEHTASIGNGPVHALDCCLRKALEKFYPVIKRVHLVDFKVRVVTAKGGTESRVRVLIESSDGTEIWGTVGVSENIIQASYSALVDSIEYKLLRDEERAVK